MASGRALRTVTSDFYKSGHLLAKHVGSLARQLRKRHPRTIFVDPCAGNLDLFSVLPSSKAYPARAFDKFPPAGTRGTVRRLDFLRSTRAKLLGRRRKARMVLVMNPPFSIPPQKNGCVLFLNQAAAVLHPGETVVCVVPQTMRRWKNIGKIHPLLHLRRELVFRRMQPFTRPGGKQSKVSVAIQVWRMHRERPRRQPALLTSHPDFRIVGYTRHISRLGPHFFINRWGTSRRVGRVSTRPHRVTAEGRARCEVGTLATPTHNVGTAYIIVPAPRKYARVLKRFRSLYNNGSGAWHAYTKFTSAGSDNPAVVYADIYTLYHRGLRYVDKRRYKVRQQFV